MQIELIMKYNSTFDPTFINPTCQKYVYKVYNC